MTPLQQLRIWLRRASTAERTMTTVAVVIIVALFGWLVTPVHSGSGPDSLQSAGGDSGTPLGAASPSAPNLPGGATGTTTGGSGAPVGVAAGSIGGAGTTGGSPPAVTGRPRLGTGTGGTSTTTGARSGPTRHCPPAALGQGVTDKQIDVAVTIVNLAGAAGNEALKVPSPEEQEQYWQHVADSINASGGAACRKLVLHYYTVNPLDSNEAQQKCLQIAADHPFIALDTGSLTRTGSSDCIPAQQIPLLSQFVSKDQIKEYYPYYLNPLGLQEDNYHSGYLGAKQKGYFSAVSGFRTMGVMFQSCRPSIIAAGRAALRRAGISDNATVGYDLGCPPGRQTSPADFQQAVLTFKNAGVTHVTELDVSDWAGFTRAAGQQNFKPRYVFAEDVAANDTFGAFAPDRNNFDGGIDIVGRRLGEQNTPGYKPSAATVRCNAIFAKHGIEPVYKQGAGYGGVACNMLWFITALFEDLPRLQRMGLAGGLHALGIVDASFPWGPVDFSAVPAGQPYGREYWRVDQFSKACGCWRVADPTFRPAFA